MPPNSLLSRSTSLAITNPLVLYRSLIARNQIQPDVAQHRLALHLQKIYLRLKDYSPQDEYASRLKALNQVVGYELDNKEEDTVTVPSHSLRGNLLSKHLFLRKQLSDARSLVRVLSDQEAASTINSPQGFLLHGEVGTGKSMLLDLLADSLPNEQKRRWHFNTFMLETLAQLERLRTARLSGPYRQDAEWPLLWLARQMIERSPILFLDEFQLPDRAASKILSNLLTIFFQLGGVLIASSNRMPDELAKASGVEFASAPGKRPSYSGRKGSPGMFPSDMEYSGFVGVLKSRCEIWNMEGDRDWRRAELDGISVEDAEGLEPQSDVSVHLSKNQTRMEFGFTESNSEEDAEVANVKNLRKYVLSACGDDTWARIVQDALPPNILSPIPWTSTTLLVFGRKVLVPQHYEGVTSWTFSALCGGTFGPADYLTLASTFHTFVLDEVPVLHALQKNEARRLITLLDALYEARCKLIVRAEAGPDDIFFPEAKVVSPDLKEAIDENDGDDAVYPETLSEIYQDQTSPFRPNILSYTDQPRQAYNADQDSDFGGPHGRGEDISHSVNFGRTSSFTGEDERFAYKRAQSRLWELCGARWHARSSPGWWRPLPLEQRGWERKSQASRLAESKAGKANDIRMGESVGLDEHAGLQGKSSLKHKMPPPQIGWTHAWGMVKWGKKAGIWGEGPNGQSKKDGSK